MFGCAHPNGVMDTIKKDGLGDTSSNPELSCLHFTYVCIQA